MSLAFVTTFNKKLYSSYAKRFVEEFENYSSKDISLYILFEGEVPNELFTISKNIYPIKLVSNKQNLFFKNFGKLQEAKGFKIHFFEENGKSMMTIKQDFRFNAVKFSFKPFSIFESLIHLPKKINNLVWIDSDLRCKSFFNKNDLDIFLPKSDELMTYLGRKNAYSECGFLGFNMQHPQFTNYIDRIIEIYCTGEIFSLEEWHDSWIWDHVRHEFEKNGKAIFKDISNKEYNGKHVFVNSGLERFFDHLKGPFRKKKGSSFAEDYKN